jgi:hypothetical protein
MISGEWSMDELAGAVRWRYMGIGPKFKAPSRWKRG